MVNVTVECGSHHWNWLVCKTKLELNTDDYLVSFPPKDKCWAFCPSQLGLTPKPFMHEFIAGLDWKKTPLNSDSTSCDLWQTWPCYSLHTEVSLSGRWKKVNLFACNLSVSNQFLEWSFFCVFENNSYHFRRTGVFWGFPLFLDFWRQKCDKISRRMPNETFYCSFLWLVYLSNEDHAAIKINLWETEIW